MDQETTFYLVRHGEADHNIRRILDSFPGNPTIVLTDSGKMQAKEAGEEISHSGADLLFASPMRRTRETAEIISELCGGLSIVFDKRLRETDVGIWNGKSADEFWKRYPTPSIRLDGNDEENIEGFVDERARLAEFLADILIGENRGKRIVIVSHGDPIEQLHGIMVGEDVSTAMMGWSPKTGSVLRVEVPAGFRDEMIKREPSLRVAGPDDMLSV